MESGGSRAGGDSNGDDEGGVQKNKCVVLRRGWPVATTGRGGGGSVEERGDERDAGGETATGYDADEWCNEWY